MDKHWEKHISAHLNSLEVTPPESSWNSISNKLEDHSNNRWMLWIGIPLLISLAFGFKQDSNTKLKLSLQVAAQKKQNQNVVIHPKRTPIIESHKTAQKRNSNELAQNSIQNGSTKKNTFKQASTRPVNDIENATSQVEQGKSSTANFSPMKAKIGTGFKLPDSQVMPDRSFQLPDYGPRNPISKLGLFVGLGYSPLFSFNNLISEEDIPINQTIHQDNLVRQTVKNFEANSGYSHQVNLYAGIQVGQGFDFITGVNYSRWQGSANLYLQNNYEVTSTYTKEHVSVEVIREIVQESQTGNLNTEGLVKILGGNPGVGNAGLVHGKIDSISMNQPTQREITRTETTVTYEEVSVIEEVEYNDTITTSFEYTQIEIPFLLRYRFGNKRLKGVITGGFSTVITSTLNLNSVAISQYDRSYSNSTVSPSFRQWNAMLSVGLQYQLTSNWHLNALPFGKFGMNGNSSNRPISGGCAIGIEYSF